jgi:hypothetical protein
MAYDKPNTCVGLVLLAHHGDASIKSRIVNGLHVERFHVKRLDEASPAACACQQTTCVSGRRRFTNTDHNCRATYWLRTAGPAGPAAVA